MKRTFTALLVACAWGAIAAAATMTVTVEKDFASAEIVKLEAAGAEYGFISMEGTGPADLAVGSPALPEAVEVVELPRGARFTGAEVTLGGWRRIAEGVTLLPVQAPVEGNVENPPFTPPDSAYYSLDEYILPESGADGTFTDGGVVKVPVRIAPYRYNPASGVIEAAGAVTIAISYLKGSVPMEAAIAAEDKIDYVLIAPPKYYTNWVEYVEWRATTRPGMTLIAKNAIEIYEDYPYAGYISTNGTAYTAADPANNVWRNAAESIHAYLRAMHSAHGLEYAVLAGAWFNCRSSSPGKFYGGEMMSITNAIPGLYVNGGWGQQPSDFFYACLDLLDGTYPWDKDGDGVYGKGTANTAVDVIPDIAVSRISFKPSTYVAAGMSVPEMIEAYTNKLAKSEAEDFAGNHRFSANWGPLKGSMTISQTTYTGRDYEFEYFDGMKNIFDPAHGNSLYDKELATRLFFRNGVARNLPLGGMVENNSSATEAGYFEMIQTCAHGLETGTCGFLTSTANNAKGLSKLYCAISPCLTGCPDWNENGYVQPSLAETFIQNPKGGTVVSFAGGRVGYYQPDGNMYTYGPDLYSKRIEYHFFSNAIVGTNSLGKAWQMFESQMAINGSMGNGQSRWCLYNQFMYGDPLVRFSTPEHFYASYPNRRMTGLASAESEATVAADGGTGLDPFAFTGDCGKVTFASPSSYYVGGVTNAAEVVLAGTNTTLDLTLVADLDKLTLAAGGRKNIVRTKAAGALAKFMPLELNDSGVVLETNQAGGTEPSTNLFARLDGGTLGFYPNPNYGLSAGSWECILQPIEMKNGSTFTADRTTTLALGSSKYPGTASFSIAGTNAWTSTNGGAIKLCGTTEVKLAADSCLQINANVLDNGNGSLKFTGTGAAEFVSASGAGGTLEIGEGVTMILDAIPFAHLTNLVVGANARIILPESDSDFWQIAPLTGCTVSIDGSAQFYEAGDEENAITGTLTTGGAYFRSGAVQEWNVASGVWSEDESYKPWSLGGVMTNYNASLATYFGNIAGSTVATVNVDGPMASASAIFANGATEYDFVRNGGDETASLVFNKLVTGGDIASEVQISAISDIDVMGGKFIANATNYPAVSTGTIAIEDGAEFGAASVYSTIPSIRGFRVLFQGCTSSTVDIIEIFGRINGKTFGKGTGFSALGGTMFDSNGSDAANLKRLYDNSYNFGINGATASAAWTAPYTAGETYFGVMFSKPLPLISYLCLGAKSSNRPTYFQLQVTQDGTNWQTVANRWPTFGSYNIGGWDGNSTDGTYNGISLSTPKSKTAITVNEGGAIRAEGKYYADITFAEGAALKAVAGSTGLELESGATFNFPDEGTIAVDTSEIDFNTVESQIIVTNTSWSASDLKRFAIDVNNAELRLVDGSVYAVAVDGSIQPPYLLGVCGTTTWDTDSWYWYDETADETNAWKKFEKKWSEYRTKESATVEIDLCSDSGVVLDVDTDVKIDTLTACGTNNQPSVAIKLTSSNGSSLAAETLDFSIFPGALTLDIENLSGTLSMPGGGLVFTKSATNAVLAADSSGLIAFDFADAGSLAYPLIALEDAGSLTNLTLAASVDTETANYTLTTVGNILYAVDLKQYRAAVEAGTDPLEVTIAEPYHNYEFNGNLNQSNNQASLTLKSSNNPTYVESRGDQAMTVYTGYCDGDTAFALGSSGRWTVTATARLCATDNHIVFAVGRKTTAGIALTSKSADMVSVAYWYSSGNHGNLIEVAVPKASSQFHHYAIRVSGTLVELFVDGEKAGEGQISADHIVSGSTGFQFHSVHGGLPGGLSGGGDEAIDNFSMYQRALSELEIIKLAVANPLWPYSGTLDIPEGEVVKLSSRPFRDYYECAVTGGGLIVLDTETMPDCDLTLGDAVKVYDMYPATPIYNLDFDGNYTNNGSVATWTVSESGTAEYVEGRRGQAVKGSTYQGGSMTVPTTSYTINSWMKMGGVTNTCAWSIGGPAMGGAGIANGNGSTVFFMTYAAQTAYTTLCAASVPDATTAYHMYSIRILNAQMEFFVDGLKVGSGTALYQNSKANGNMRIHGIVNDGANMKLGKDTTGAIDNWSYYTTVMSDLKLRALVFADDYYVVEVAQPTGASIYLDDALAPGSEVYSAGTELVYTLSNLARKYTFRGWTGTDPDDTVDGTTLTIPSLSASRSLGADVRYTPRSLKVMMKALK